MTVWRTLVLLGALVASGCATQPPTPEAFAAGAGLAPAEIDGDGFRHRVYVGKAGGDAVLDVYIEGDGVPWQTPDQVASDPTPRRALALELMAADPGPSAYLGRPCYFGHAADSGCDPALWTDRRYGPQVVDSMAAALRRLGATRLRLIGYSGGGVLAVLLAARVKQVVGIVTVSADLDTTAWTRRRGYSALAGSLNPADAPALSSSIDQLYLMAGDDRVVPPDTADRYLGRVPAAATLVWPGFDHSCCWLQVWGGLIRAVRAAEPPPCATLGCRPWIIAPEG